MTKLINEHHVNTFPYDLQAFIMYFARPFIDIWMKFSILLVSVVASMTVCTLFSISSQFVYKYPAQDHSRCAWSENLSGHCHQTSNSVGLRLRSLL